jgi:hypothetical protein
MDELGYRRVCPISDRPPAVVRRRERRGRWLAACRSWIRDGDGWLKSGVRRLVRAVPGLHKLAYRIVKW